MMKVRRWTLPTLILLIAAFFRFHHLADHPLGLFFDPAINALDAIRLMERGGHLLFFPTNGGRESLFIYLLIPFITLFDTTPFAVRALTASLSLLTVAALYRFLRDVSQTAADGQLIPVAAQLPLLATLTLAVSYWHISVSRLGQRPIMIPLLTVLTLWFFWRAWHTRQAGWFVATGIILGLGAYTYSAARLLPVIVGVALLTEILRRGNALRPATQGRPPTFERPRGLLPTTRNLLMLGLTAAAIAAPMGWYFLSYPTQFSARAGSVMVWHFLDTPADIAPEIGRNLWRVIGFFGWSGSPNPIFGLPNQPGLHPLLTPFLLLGLLIAVRRWRDLFHRLMLISWLVGLLPSVIAIEAPHPLRMIVALVPTTVLVGIGLNRLMLFQGRLSMFKIRHRLAYLLPLSLYLVASVTTYHAFFNQWTALQATRGVYDYGAIAIRDEIKHLTLTQNRGETSVEPVETDFDRLSQQNEIKHQPGQPIYLPFDRFNSTTLLYYLSGLFDRQARLTVPPSESATLISPPQMLTATTWIRLHHGEATILPPLTAAGQALVQRSFALPTTDIRTADGETVAQRVTVPTDLAHFSQQPTRPLTATFGALQLVGATHPLDIKPTQPLTVTLFWQANESTPHEYEILLHLVNDGRDLFAAADGRPLDWVYPTSFWQPNGETIPVGHLLHPPPTLPVGRYWLALSLFDPLTQQRLPVTNAPPSQTMGAPDTLFIGPLRRAIDESACQQVSMSPHQLVDFGAVVGLVEADVSTTAGEIRLDLCWRATTQPPLDYTVFVHLLDEADNLVTGRDTQPQNNRYPTSIWWPDEVIPDSHTLTLPSDLPSGTYRLAIGLYHQPSGTRLPLHYSHHDNNDSAGRYILEQKIIVE